MNVTSGDPNFDIGTYYYLNVYQTLSGASQVAVQYKQEKFVEILPNGIPQKFVFSVNYEKVKFFVIQVPVTSSINHKVRMNFTAIAPDHFYPSVYLNQYQSQDEPSPDDFKNLNFATIQQYQIKFGADISQVFSKTSVHEFEGQCTQSYCYWMLTVYQTTYGLDDVRKPEFELAVHAWQVESNVQARRMKVIPKAHRYLRQDQ